MRPLRKTVGLVLAVFLSGCAGSSRGPLALPEDPDDTVLERTSYHWSTNAAFGSAGISFTLHDLEPGITSCAFRIGVSGSVDGSGLGGMMVYVLENKPTRYFPTTFGWLSGNAQVDSWRASDLFVEPLGGTGRYRKYVEFSPTDFKNWTREGYFTRNTTVAVFGPNVGPVSAPHNELGSSSMLFEIDCESPVRLSLHAGREVFLALHSDFDTATMVEGPGAFYSVVHGAKSERNFTAPRVEVIAGLRTAGNDAYQAGSLRIERGTNETVWNLTDPPYPFHLIDGPGHYVMRLDRAGRDVFLLAAVGWTPVTSLDALENLTELAT